MKHLQEEIPVVFDLILSLGHYPTVITPILKEMVIKSKAPFIDLPCITEGSSEAVQQEDQLKDLCFFPTLPRIRRRRSYQADTNRRNFLCTKKSTGHPSLLPGIFTIFCHHGRCPAYRYYINFIFHFVTGICYGFQAMRLCESPDIPFTILYERFLRGMFSCSCT